MDVFEIRAKNLTSLIDRLKDQGFRMRDIAQRFGGMDPSHLSQLKSRSSNMGNKVARKIEQAYGLHDGWFDSLHDAPKSYVVAEEQASYEPTSRSIRLSEREYDLISNYRICSREAKKIIEATVEAATSEKIKQQSMLLRTHGEGFLKR